MRNSCWIVLLVVTSLLSRRHFTFLELALDEVWVSGLLVFVICPWCLALGGELVLCLLLDYVDSCSGGETTILAWSMLKSHGLELKSQADPYPPVILELKITGWSSNHRRITGGFPNIWN